MPRGGRSAADQESACWTEERTALCRGTPACPPGLSEVGENRQGLPDQLLPSPCQGSTLGNAGGTGAEVHACPAGWKGARETARGGRDASALWGLEPTRVPAGKEAWTEASLVCPAQADALQSQAFGPPRLVGGQTAGFALVRPHPTAPTVCSSGGCFAHSHHTSHHGLLVSQSRVALEPQSTAVP